MAKLINILLRKTDPDYPWGFSLGALPPALHSVQITWVDKGSLASEHLEPGDRVLEIEGIDTTMLSNAEVESMLTSPSNKLELLIMKKSKNTEKPMQNQEGCEMKKTVKTQDRISSRTEESGETKILNEDFLEESKIITREGTLHREIMETTECSENELKTDTSFWTCPPSDLVKQEVKKKIKEPNLACRNTSGSGYISESAIFKSLNNYRDELRKVDPREEKRQFWESCRKGDSIRRFKWGDSIKPNRGPSPAYKSDGSMESLYSKGESQAYPIPKMERSKSCEPMESLPSSNPFSESFPGEFHRHGVNSTNPFYKEFKSSKSHCDSSSDVKTFNSAESESKKFMDHANNVACNEGFKHKFTNEMTSSDYSKVNEFVSSENNEIVSSTVNEKFIKEEGVSQSDSCQESFFDRNDSSKCDYTYGATNFHSRSDECKEVSNQQELVSSTSAPEKQSNIQKTVRFEDNELDGFEMKSDCTQKTQPLRLTKAIGQEDFETKCKFFEKATSAPVLCANKNAKDLVEERLKEGASPNASPSVTRKTLNSSLGTNSFPEVPEDESHLHLLKKPSDFINQQFKCTPDRSITSQNPGVIPTIKVSEHSDIEKCFDERRYENVVNISSAHHQGTLEDQGAAFCSQPIYVNMSDYIANCNTSGMERNTAGSTQNSSEHSNFTYNGCENMNNTEARKSTGGEKKVIDNFSTRDYVSTNQSVSQKSSEASNNNTVSYVTSRVSANITNQPMGGGFQWYGGISPQRELNEQARSHRGGSLDRDFYEKRTFKESSFQKVTCSSDSPYQNVESASSREYQEETGPSKNVMNRSGTPAGFYDNSNIDELAKEIRSKSPLDISSRTFDDIRNRLGSLLGATPLNISCERSKLLISQGGVDKVEEAFQKLALQAGIVENKAAEHGAHLTDSTDSPRRPLQTQTSWTGNPTQSRSFRVLQKITGSEDEPAGPFPAPPSETFLVNRVLPPSQAASPVGADNSKCWNPNTPPPGYPNPNYWYYPPQSPEEQQQFWEHYNAMCAYMAQMNAAAYRYSPYPMYPYPYLYPSDNEEYSGYSSSDEMTYYGQMFKKQQEMAQAAKPVQASGEGANIGGPPLPTINRESSDSSVNSEVTEKGDSSDAVSETDTEVGEDEAKLNSLQSIKSVPNINIYNDSDSQTEESEVSEDEEEETDGEADIPHQLSIIFEESEHSDVESTKRFSLHKEQSQSNDSCATLHSNEDDENDNSTDSTVTVRLPLQFKFSRSSNDEEVATVIVGNSEVESGRATPVAPESLIITDIVREDSDPDVTATICLKKFKKPSLETSACDYDKPKSVTPSVDTSYCNFDDNGSTSDSPVDFWRELSDKDNDTTKLNHRAQNETPSQTSEDDSKHDESDYHSSSTSIQTVKKGLSGSENLSGSETENAPNDVKGQSPERQESSEDESEDETEVNKDHAEKEEAEDEDEAEEESESSEYESDEDEDVDGKCGVKSVEEEKVSITIPVKMEQTQECREDTVIMKSLEVKKTSEICQEEEDESEEEDETEESERSSSSSSGEDEEEEEEQKHTPKTIVKKETPRQPSKLETHKSQEESEEDDSGVTSDLSRHISETDTDPECGGELRKMTRYQRAATHSRLFKLLQDECKVDEGPEEEPIALSARKERLSLPLHQYSTEQDSLSSSSGINSPSSPTTTDKLVKELVKSLLSRKKGRHFRKLPLEKLHAAALRILQEDMDPYDTASTSDESNNILSPVASTSSNPTNDTIPNVGMANPELYGGNYYDYCNYYSTWGHQDPYGSADIPDEYEIVPSKAFRILQENTQPERYSSPVPKIAFPVRCPRVAHPPLQDPNPPPETNANPISESTSTSQET